METRFECLACFLRQAVNASRVAGATEEQAELILRDVLQHLEESDWRLQPPLLAVELFRTVRRTTCNDDPYAADKAAATRLANALVTDLRPRVETSDDPFAAAVRVAMAGNVIDPVAFDRIDRDLVAPEIERALAEPLAVDHVDALRQALLATDGPVLYLADNAGEIVLDRLLVEQIIAAGVPAERITLMTRGAPVINDALVNDAVDAGIDELVTVVSSGVDAPGMLLELVDDEALARYHDADVVIAKGQGNFEALPTDDPRVFFLLRVKCTVVARHTGLERGDQVVMRGGWLRGQLTDQKGTVD
jgi:damage-control phosphatase, subfamily I